MTTEISVAVLAPIGVGLTQVVKMLGLPAKFIPLAAITIGVGLSVLIMSVVHFDLITAIFNGLISGLSSVGLYSGVSKTIENFKVE